MQCIQHGDQDCFRTLYYKYQKLVFNMALTIIRDRDTAEEVTQDIFMAIWQQPDKWNPQKGRLTTWLLSITRYTAIDRLRHEKRRPPLLESPLENVSHLLVERHAPALSRADIRLLQGLLNQLPSAQQTVITLAYFRGKTHSEIAAELGIPVGTVKSRLRLGLKKLKDEWVRLTDEQPEPHRS